MLSHAGSIPTKIYTGTALVTRAHTGKAKGISAKLFGFLRSNEISWSNDNVNWYHSELPVTDDSPYLEYANYYINDQTYLGIKPWADKTYFRKYFSNASKLIFISSTTIPECYLNDKKLNLTDYNDEYWLWYADTSPYMQNVNVLYCTSPASSFNAFDIKFADKISNVISPFPFTFPGGGKAGNVPTMPLAALALAGAAGTAFYLARPSTVKSIRGSKFFSNVNVMASAYKIKMSLIEAVDSAWAKMKSFAGMDAKDAVEMNSAFIGMQDIAKSGKGAVTEFSSLNKKFSEGVYQAGAKIELNQKIDSAIKYYTNIINNAGGIIRDGFSYIKQKIKEDIFPKLGWSFNLNNFLGRAKNFLSRPDAGSIAAGAIAENFVSEINPLDGFGLVSEIKEMATEDFVKALKAEPIDTIAKSMMRVGPSVMFLFLPAAYLFPPLAVPMLAVGAGITIAGATLMVLNRNAEYASAKDLNGVAEISENHPNDTPLVGGALFAVAGGSIYKNSGKISEAIVRTENAKALKLTEGIVKASSGTLYSTSKAGIKEMLDKEYSNETENNVTETCDSK